MTRRYKNKRIPNNTNIPWERTTSGLRVVSAADVPPVLDAYDRIDGHGLAVWCIYCTKWHVHGHGGGHRVSHCIKEDSPYERSGYILRPVGKPIPMKRGKPIAPSST